MKICFEAQPLSYVHWKLEVEDRLATLTLKTHEDGGLDNGYRLKLNSYDLAVDIELADAIERIRFEHPTVSVVTITSGIEKIFCAGANIFMLAQSGHSFKVNFCKFTNETRLNMEDASMYSGIKFLCAANGITAGGGYELALACDRILLIDDGNSAVSLPEIPLLGVLPGTGGLTRLVDKRKVRRDLADAFCTVAEGVKGKKAAEWNLVDQVAPQKDFARATQHMQDELLDKANVRGSAGVRLLPLRPRFGDREIEYRHVKLLFDPAKRVCELTVEAPRSKQPTRPDEMIELGDELWALRAYRELNDAILRLRFNHPEIALLILKTSGEHEYITKFESELILDLCSENPHWYTKEILSLMRRVLKRLDVTSKSMVAIVDAQSCFGGSLSELLFCADQSFYALGSVDQIEPQIRLNALNRRMLPTSNGLSRLEQKFCGVNDLLDKIWVNLGVPLGAKACRELGLVTHLLDEIDYEEEIRIFCEERASLSPDALTGMESSLRFSGPETMESKIFARLSAWQNWIFTRDNATGEKGALTNYGKPTRPQFDFERC